MKKGMIYIDVEKCLACKSCELACAVVHSDSKVLSGALKETPAPQSRIKVEGTKDFSIPLQCRHCEDAPCVRICPTKALLKITEGMVILKDDLCIGCKWCINVCPFGVIKFNKKGKAVIKCDLCIERLKENKMPACISSCPTKAIKYKTVEEVDKDKHRKFLVEVEGTLKKK